MMLDPSLQKFRAFGARHFPAAAVSSLDALENALAHLPASKPGSRLHGIAGLRAIMEAKGTVGGLAEGVLGPGCRPVRAILFDKNAATNWSLDWHQDRTIAVKRRVDVDGFGPWTVKAGMPHVAPPFGLLAGMVTLRVHLDPVTQANAPLLMAPGSHLLGKVAEEDIYAVVRRCGTLACLAERGDVWLYATPILHASHAARRPTRRRVLQVDYAAVDLPGGLEWQGI
jgi:hypothetical protein